jgi:hypothetical protein
MFTSQLPGRRAPVADRPVVSDGGPVVDRARGAGRHGGDEFTQRTVEASLMDED